MRRVFAAGGRPAGGALKRLGWFVLIWLCSVAALGILALCLRMVMSVAGMTR